MLGDFGSAQKLGVHAKEMTITHWPAELDSNPGVEVLETSAAVDMFQLAVTLLECAGAYCPTSMSPGNPPKPAALREAAVRLISDDLRTFVSQLLHY